MAFELFVPMQNRFLQQAETKGVRLSGQTASTANLFI
jgi:hypothetical protein